MTTIAVTGVTGFVGSHVAAQLEEAGLHVRYLLRNPKRADEFPTGRTFIAPYSDAAACRAALAGVDMALMVSATESETREEDHAMFIDAAAAAGVHHLVYTSFLGAAEDATFTFARTHYRTEQYIKASLPTYTFLRDSFYLDLLPHFAGDDGVIRGPGGAGKVSAILRQDVARTAAAILESSANGDSRHEGKTYDLTGPEALSLAEIAQITSELTGCRLSYYDETEAEARASRASYNPPDWLMQAWISTYTAIKAGEMATVSSAVTDITGKPPTSLRDFLSRA